MRRLWSDPHVQEDRQPSGGSAFLPEVDDEVLVGFNQSDGSTSTSTSAGDDDDDGRYVIKKLPGK